MANSFQKVGVNPVGSIVAGQLTNGSGSDQLERIVDVAARQGGSALAWACKVVAECC
jgi:hypothetical protein